MRDWTPTLGAVYREGATVFRVWAPDSEHIDLVIDSDRVRGRPRFHPLAREPHGYWSARVADMPAGTRYRYRIDEDDARTFPDPASRFQPEGVHGPSEVVDPATYAWSRVLHGPPAIEDLVIYEIHVGTFTEEGTYRGVIERLPYLSALGVTAIELMPLGDFPGDRNWGYDGAAIFAPARCYGRPDDLRALVDAAHQHGLAVLLDVVYNHFGPDGAYANAFSRHYFTDAHQTPWGRGINLDGPNSPEVRRFLIENALHWIHEYRIDGLRLDATHAMQDNSPVHVLAELTSTVRQHTARDAMFVAEDHRNLVQMLEPVDEGGFGIDAVWADDFHHQVRVRMAGDREAYFQDFRGSTEDLATTLRQGWFFRGQHSQHLNGPRGTDPVGISPRRMVIGIQNHDQVGNRADGARLHQEIDPASYRAATAMMLLAPETPLLFMGQEWATSSPFLFFTDHNDELGPLVTQGRRDEFSAFDAFSDPASRSRIPDPQDRSTFERSRLNWTERDRVPHAGVLQLYRRLLELRQTMPALRKSDRASFDARAVDADTIAMQASGAGAVTGGRRSVDREDLLTVVRIGSPGVARVRLMAAGNLSGAVILTTEDPAFVQDVREIRVTHEDVPQAPGSVTASIAFERPGAIVFRGVRLAR